MPYDTESPSFVVWVKAAYGDWGSRVSGAISVPLSVFALLVAAGVFGQDTVWWNAQWAVRSWFIMAVLVWVRTGYVIWAKERRQVLSLHGMPKVTIEASVIDIGVREYEAIFHARNGSDDIATNILINSFECNSLRVSFEPIGSIGPFGKMRAGYQVAVEVLGDVKPSFLLFSSDRDPLPSDGLTQIEFSNYGAEKTWIVDYTIRIDYSKNTVVCTPGEFRLKSEK